MVTLTKTVKTPTGKQEVILPDADVRKMAAVGGQDALRAIAKDEYAKASTANAKIDAIAKLLGLI